MAIIREVRKRDGRVVPFDETKIVDAIYKAVRSVGKGDRALAEDLASAVTHFFEKKFAGTIPGIEDIQDQVETVLIETGHAEIAKAYILYRNKRTSVRDVLQVRKPPPERSPQEGPGGAKLVEDRMGVAPWSKSKIAAALIREADMEADMAEEIAGAVERKVFASGLRRISTSLIRELVDNELFERGFSAKLFRQAPIGLPRYNLEQIIFGTDTKEGFTFPKTPVEVRDFIATEILKQYALEEMHSGVASDAHRDGRIHIHGLGDPIRFARLNWDLGELAPASPGSTPAGALGAAEIFRKFSRLAHFVGGEIRLQHPDSLLSRIASSEGVEAVFRRLKEIQAGPPGASFALELVLSRSAIPWLRALGDLPPKGPAIYLRLSPEGLSDPSARAALECAAALFERGEAIEFLPGFAPAGRRFPEGDEPGIQPIASAITINLPRAAFRSAEGRLGLIEREIEDVVEVVIKAQLQRRRFIERLGANHENPLWDLLGRSAPGGGRPLVDLAKVEFPVGIIGLNECVKFLTGHELHQDPRARRSGEEIIDLLSRKIEKDARGLGLRLVLAETRNSGSIRRLEEIDRRRYAAESGEIDRGRPAGEWARYSDGVRLHRLAPVDPLGRIEHLCLTIDRVAPIGVIEDSPELRSGGRELILSLLEESIPLFFPEGSISPGQEGGDRVPNAGNSRGVTR
jgi:transcriptional regulator NrdR family protein